VLLAGSALAATGMFVPWWHYQICDPTVDNCQPQVPVAIENGAGVLILLAPIPVALAAGFSSLLLHGVPGLRLRRALILWPILLGVVSLVMGLLGTAWITLTGMFINAFAETTQILDSRCGGAYHRTTVTDQ
jgi:hypothetical protein